MTPFDSPVEPRVLVAAGRAYGTPTLVAQHGFRGGFNDPDLTFSDHVAVWSTRDRDDVAPRAAGHVLVTGNPGADHVVREGRPRGGDRTVLLIDYAGRLTARVGTRNPLQHAAAALSGLARVRPGSEVVVRPHPSDQRAHHYEGALADVRGDLRLTLDGTTPIEELLLSADLCIGAQSTATLQAAVLGVPTVLLDVSGTPRPWPFDGSDGALTLARSDEELAQCVAAAPDGAAAAAEALGVTGRATQSVLRLIDELSGAQPRLP